MRTVADDQHADLVHQEQELHARKAKLQVQEKEDEPRKVYVTTRRLLAWVRNSLAMRLMPCSTEHANGQCST